MLSRRDLLTQAMGAAGMSAFGSGRAAAQLTPQCPQVGAAPAVAPAQGATPLGTIAASKNLALGVQLGIAGNRTYGDAMYDPVYRGIVFRESPAFVAYGSAFKFGVVCPDPPIGGTLAFTQKAYGVTDTWYAANDLTAFVQAQGARGRADALIWNVADDAPPWLKTLPERGGAAALDYNLAFLRKYMSAAMKKLTQLQAGRADYFHAVGIVNEPIIPNWGEPASPSPATYRDGPFLPPGQRVDATHGVPAYIQQAFAWGDYYRKAWARLLRQPASTAKFFINETLCDTDQYGPTMRAALLTLLQKMQRAGLKLDAVGLECHLQPQMMHDPANPDWTAFGAFIQAIGALGLDVYITELDVLDYETSCYGAPGTAPASDDLVGIYFDTFLRKVLSYSNVKAICFWDLSDRYTFYRYFDEATWYGYNQIPRPKPADTPWPNCPTLPANAASIACPRPDVFDDAYAAKPARQRIADALAAAPVR